MASKFDTWDFRRRDQLRQASAVYNLPYDIGRVQADLEGVLNRLRVLALVAFDPTDINLAAQNVQGAIDELRAAGASEQARIEVEAASIAAETDAEAAASVVTQIDEAA